MNSKSSKPYDTASKYLTEQDPEALLRLLGCTPAGEQAEIKRLSNEFSVSAKITDLIYLLKINGHESISFIEVQAAYYAKVPYRMADYNLRIWIANNGMETGIRVDGYVLLLTDKGLSAYTEQPLLLNIGDIRMEANFTLIKVWELDAQVALSMERDSLLPLVPLMHGSRAELTEAARRLNTVSDRQQLEELSLHFVMLAGLRYNKQEILAALGDIGMIPLEQLKESSFYQYILEEGEQKGREEGRQEGLQEGQLRESSNTLIKLIAKRSPQLDLQAEINTIADLPTLEDLCLKVIDATNAEEMQQWVMERTEHK